MKHSLALCAFCVVLFAIGCQSSEQPAAPAATTTTTGTTPTAPAPNATGGNATNTSSGATSNGESNTAAGPAGGYAAVQAIFNANCMPCHSSTNHRAGLDLSSYDAAMKGGEGGAEVVAGKPESSRLIQYLTGAKKPRMPMKRPPLSDDQMKTIKDWITAGAKNSS